MPSKFRYEFSISRSGKQIGSQMNALGVHLVSKNASLPGKLIYGGFDLFFFGLEANLVGFVFFYLHVFNYVFF